MCSFDRARRVLLGNFNRYSGKFSWANPFMKYSNPNRGHPTWTLQFVDSPASIVQSHPSNFPLNEIWIHLSLLPCLSILTLFFKFLPLFSEWFRFFFFIWSMLFGICVQYSLSLFVRSLPDLFSRVIIGVFGVQIIEDDEQLFEVRDTHCVPLCIFYWERHLSPLSADVANRGCTSFDDAHQSSISNSLHLVLTSLDRESKSFPRRMRSIFTIRYRTPSIHV